MNKEKNKSKNLLSKIIGSSKPFSIVLALFFTFFGFSVVFFSTVQAQIGGQFAFASSKLSIDSRSAALGGLNILRDLDTANEATQNFALVNDSLRFNLGINTGFLPGNIWMNEIGSVLNIPKFRPIAVQLKYLDYGSIEGFDSSGISIGNLRAQDLSLSIGTSTAQIVGDRLIELGFGINILHSVLNTNNASAITGQVGMHFKHPNQLFNLGLVINNFGFVLNDFDESSESSVLPILIDLASKYKFKHAPFQIRFGLNDIVQIGKEEIKLNGNRQNNIEKREGVNAYTQHVVVGVDFIPSKNIILHLTYNSINNSFQVEEAGGLAGLNAGLTVQTRKFQLGFAKQFFGPFGSTNQFSLQLKI